MRPTMKKLVLFFPIFLFLAACVTNTTQIPQQPRGDSVGPLDASSSLTMANGILYTSSNGFLYALNAQTGAILWRYPMTTPLQPLISNGILYVASFQAGIYTLNPKNGTLLWHDPLNSMHAGYATRPVILGSKLFVETIDLGTGLSKAILHALNVSNGAEDWYVGVSQNISTIDVAA